MGILAGGMKHPLGGNFFYPTLIADVDPSSALFCEEIFGPVAAVCKFDKDEDVMTERHPCRFGCLLLLAEPAARLENCLGAGVWNGWHQHGHREHGGCAIWWGQG